LSTSFSAGQAESRRRLSVIELCERGWIPDVLARMGMRALMRQRLRAEGLDHGELRSQRFNRLLETLRKSPIAIDTEAANSQHYEVPAAFFDAHLGPRLKYSCCLYPSGRETLAQAEEAMLELYAERAQLADGQRILDLGCGWGSLSLWLAERYPNAQVVGLSNSHGQREFIERQAAQRCLKNLRIVTGDIVDFEFATLGMRTSFDRVVSIEMLEHMKNYGALFAKLASWMKPGGKLFAHVFAHRLLAYPFEVKDRSDWMTEYFFRGGTMPSEALFAHFQEDLKLAQHWWVSGTHYERTANDWLRNMDRARAQILPLFECTYGSHDARQWFQRWRMFYMAVAELFGYAGGNEWGVVHYLFERPA